MFKRLGPIGLLLAYLCGLAYIAAYFIEKVRIRKYRRVING